jgi:hypothetical protein
MFRLHHPRGQRVAWADVPARFGEETGTGSAIPALDHDAISNNRIMI